jgi:(p)ppGpp synthase/HD superfamily hydrolase
MVGPRYAAAVSYATEAHEGQVRKGTAIPYISHPISVSALVLEHGGDEDQAIAGLLHDVVEDCGEEHLELIQLQFGPRVAAMVQGCTDGVANADGRKPPWRERKEAYLRHLAAADQDVLIVSACDKLHNARAIEADKAAIGPAVFERFTAGSAGTRWYYWALHDVFMDRLGESHPLVVGLRVTLNRTYA